MPTAIPTWLIYFCALAGLVFITLAVRDTLDAIARAVRTARAKAARGYGRTLPAFLWEVAVGLHRHRARRSTYKRLHDDIARLETSLDLARRYGDAAAGQATTASQQLAVLEALVCHGPLLTEHLTEYGGRVGMAPKAIAQAADALARRGTVLNTEIAWQLREPVAYKAGAITGNAMLADAVEFDEHAEAEAMEHVDLRV